MVLRSVLLQLAVVPAVLWCSGWWCSSGLCVVLSKELQCLVLSRGCGVGWSEVKILLKSQKSLADYGLMIIPESLLSRVFDNRMEIFCKIGLKESAFLYCKSCVNIAKSQKYWWCLNRRSDWYVYETKTTELVFICFLLWIPSKVWPYYWCLWPLPKWPFWLPNKE